MILEKKVSCLFVGAGSIFSLLTCHAAIAQPIIPAADGTNTQVTVEGNQFNIDGGQLSGDGANLFHSFQEFGLNAEQTANFLSQPDIQNILGRVNGGNASFIDGLLQVTGGNSNLYLINPSGILFGPNAQLNLPANFTAATATGIGFEGGWFDMSTTAYSELTGVPELLGFDGTALGNLVNSGDLAVAEGQTLSLLGGTVINTGEIEAPGGNIIISAIAAPEGGSAIVRLSPVDGILSLDMQAEALVATTPDALSLPQLITGGGFVESATGLTVNEAGVAVLSGSGVQIDDEAGTAIISGQLTVAGEVGGEVQVTGDRVGLLTATVDASGINGGGTALIGGDYKGQGVLPTAQQTYVSDDSAIDVSSAETGNAGRAIVWADDATRFYGTIDAQGGQLAGDGGFVEISGAQNLTFDGDVLLNAPNGNAGSLLLDPQIIQIVAGSGGANDAQVTGDNAIFAADGGAGSTFVISEQALESLSGSVTLEATEQIRIESLTDNNLSFNAGPGDTVIFRTSPAFDDSISIGPIIGEAAIETNGGNLVWDIGRFGGAGPLTTTFALVSNGGDIDITSAADIFGPDLIDSSSNISSGGDVTLSVGESAVFIRDINTSSSSVTPGNADGGNVTITTGLTTDTSVGVTFTNTSSENGNAGNVNYVGGRRIGGGAIGGLSILASAPNGRAGDITLEAVGRPEEGVIGDFANLRSFVAVSGIGEGGNLTFRGDEVNFDPNGEDPSFEGTNLGPSNPLQLSGQLIFEPQSPGQDILIGGSGFNDPNFFGDPGDDTLHISAFELNPLSDQPNVEGTFNGADGGVLIRTDGTGTIEFASTLEDRGLFSDITVVGGPESVIIGPDQATDYIILGTGAGIISGFGSDLDSDGIQDTYLRFEDVGTIQAGDEDDALVFLNDDATFDGNFDGSGGDNVLDFSGNTSVSSAVFPEGVTNNNVDGYNQALNVDLTADPAVTLVADPTFVIVEGEVSNITGVIGGSGDDTILGDEGSNLLGGGGGSDTIDGRGGDDIVEIERDASFELLEGNGTFDNELRIDNGNDGTFEETEQISNVEIARLLGGAGDNTFTIGADSWQGPLILLDGSDGNDTYDIGIDGVGTGSIVVGDTGTAGTDTLTVVGSDGDDVFALDVAGSPNPGGFDPTPPAGLSLSEDAALLARLDEDATAFSPAELSLLDNIDILDTLDERGPNLEPLPEPAYKVSRVSLAAETAAFSGIENLGFDGAEGSDAYTPTLGATSAENLLDITITDTGTSGQDSLAVSGNAFTNEFEIALATDPNSLSELSFESPNFNIGEEIINFSGLEDVSLDGAADTAGGSVGDTYTLSLGSPSEITLDINDSGGVNEGIDTLVINGTPAIDTFEVGASSVNLLETSEQVPYSGIDALSINAQAGADTITVTEAIQFGFGLDLDAGADGGEIAVNGDISVGSELVTNQNTLVNQGITLETINGSINASGGSLSTVSTASGGSDPITLTATGDITTGTVTTASTAGPSSNVSIQTSGNIDTSNGAIDTSSNTSTGGRVTLEAGGNVTTGAITSSGTGVETASDLPSGVIAITSETGSINTTGAALTTASTNGRGAAIDLQAANSIATGELVTTGQTSGGGVTIEGTTVQAVSINAQGAIVAGGDVAIAANQVQVSDTFTDNNGVVASISTVGATDSGEITITFPEETTFVVGDSTVNGTTGAITSDVAILPITSITENFEQGNIQIIIPTIPDFVINTDFQTLIEDPAEQAPGPLICVFTSNLRSEAGIELLPDQQEGNPFCPPKHKASAE